MMSETPPRSVSPDAARATLRWYADIGVDETVADEPEDWFQPPAPAPVMAAGPENEAAGGKPVERAIAAPAQPARPPVGAEQAIADAASLAAQADSVEALRAALAGFDGCALKKTAKTLCFIDGNPAAKIMFVGEGPGAEEDRQGKPFVGPSGQLLDRMMASIGLDRDHALISNTVFWRPPGNRTPTPAETEICRPFVERLIQLVRPGVIVAVGGPAAKMLLGEAAGIGRLRGKWYGYTNAGLDAPVPATAIFHPAYLLRSPQMKRETWRDLLMLRARIDELGLMS